MFGVGIVSNDESREYRRFFIKEKDLVLYSDYKIAEYLKIKLEKYRKILIKCGAKQSAEDDECYFNKEKDVKKAIEKLESYLIMAKIME